MKPTRAKPSVRGSNGTVQLPIARIAAHDLDEVAGCLRSKLKSKKPARIQFAIRAEVNRRRDQGRY